MSDPTELKAMEDIEFLVQHSHKAGAIRITQRYKEYTITGDGMTVPEDKEAVIDIPYGAVADLLAEVMAHMECMLNVQEKVDHNAPITEEDIENALRFLGGKNND